MLARVPSTLTAPSHTSGHWPEGGDQQGGRTPALADLTMDQGITKEAVVSCCLNPDAWAKRQGEVAAIDQAQNIYNLTEDLADAN